MEVERRGPTLDAGFPRGRPVTQQPEQAGAEAASPTKDDAPSLSTVMHTAQAAAREGPLPHAVPSAGDTVGASGPQRLTVIATETPQHTWNMSLAVDGAHVHLEHVFGIEDVVMAAQLLRAAAFDDGQLLPDLGRCFKDAGLGSPPQPYAALREWPLLRAVIDVQTLDVTLGALLAGKGADSFELHNLCPKFMLDVLAHCVARCSHGLAGSRAARLDPKGALQLTRALLQPGMESILGALLNLVRDTDDSPARSRDVTGLTGPLRRLSADLSSQDVRAPRRPGRPMLPRALITGGCVVQCSNGQAWEARCSIAGQQCYLFRRSDPIVCKADLDSFVDEFKALAASETSPVEARAALLAKYRAKGARGGHGAGGGAIGASRVLRSTPSPGPGPREDGHSDPRKAKRPRSIDESDAEGEEKAERDDVVLALLMMSQDVCRGKPGQQPAPVSPPLPATHVRAPTTPPATAFTNPASPPADYAPTSPLAAPLTPEPLQAPRHIFHTNSPMRIDSTPGPFSQPPLPARTLPRSPVARPIAPSEAWAAQAQMRATGPVASRPGAYPAAPASLGARPSELGPTQAVHAGLGMDWQSHVAHAPQQGGRHMGATSQAGVGAWAPIQQGFTGNGTAGGARAREVQGVAMGGTAELRWSQPQPHSRRSPSLAGPRATSLSAPLTMHGGVAVPAEWQRAPVRMQSWPHAGPGGSGMGQQGAHVLAVPQSTRAAPAAGAGPGWGAAASARPGAAAVPMGGGRGVASAQGGAFPATAGYGAGGAVSGAPAGASPAAFGDARLSHPRPAVLGSGAGAREGQRLLGSRAPPSSHVLPTLTIHPVRVVPERPRGAYGETAAAGAGPGTPGVVYGAPGVAQGVANGAPSVIMQGTPIAANGTPVVANGGAPGTANGAPILAHPGPLSSDPNPSHAPTARGSAVEGHMGMQPIAAVISTAPVPAPAPGPGAGECVQDSQAAVGQGAVGVPAKSPMENCLWRQEGPEGVWTAWCHKYGTSWRISEHPSLQNCERDLRRFREIHGGARAAGIGDDEAFAIALCQTAPGEGLAKTAPQPGPQPPALGQGA